MSSERTGEDAAGVGMIIAAYCDESAADAALDALEQAKRGGVFAFDDAVRGFSVDFYSGPAHLSSTHRLKFPGADCALAGKALANPLKEVDSLDKRCLRTGLELQ